MRTMFNVLALVTMVLCTSYQAANAATSTTAPEVRHEILLGTSGLLGVAGETTGANITLNSGTSIGFSGGYNYSVIPELQLGVLGFVTYLSASGSSNTIWNAFGGATFNIPINDDIREAVFVSAYGGGADNGAGTKIAILADLGKRFRLAENVTFRPSAGIYKMFATGSNLLIVIRPVSFSVMF